MSVKTGGPVRGFLGRWTFRFEASSLIFRIVFLGITAASTFTTALASVGYAHIAPWFLAAGTLASPVFAYLYVKHIHSRKNREGSDLGDNYSGPNMLIDDILIAHAVYAARNGKPPSENESKQMRQAIKQEWARYRDGAILDEEELDA